MTKYCTYCGKPVEDRDVFCSNCGGKIDRGTETIVESTYNIYPKLKGCMKDNEKRMKKILKSKEKLINLFKKFDQKNEEYLKELNEENNKDLKSLQNTQNSINKFIEEITNKITEESLEQSNLLTENVKNDLIITKKENKTQIKDNEYLDNLTTFITEIKNSMNQENTYLIKFTNDLEFNASYYTIYFENKEKLIKTFENHKNSLNKITKQLDKLEQQL